MIVACVCVFFESKVVNGRTVNFELMETQACNKSKSGKFQDLSEQESVVAGEGELGKLPLFCNCKAKNEEKKTKNYQAYIKIFKVDN